MSPRNIERARTHPARLGTRGVGQGKARAVQFSTKVQASHSPPRVKSEGLSIYVSYR